MLDRKLILKQLNKMTTRQLAKYPGLARARIKQIESAEPKSAVTLLLEFVRS